MPSSHRPLTGINKTYKHTSSIKSDVRGFPRKNSGWLVSGIKDTKFKTIQTEDFLHDFQHPKLKKYLKQAKTLKTKD